MVFFATLWAFLLHASSVSGEAIGTENTDHNCHLQVGSHVEDSAKLEKCPLPESAQWCTVRIGLKHDTFEMAVYNSADIVSQSICSTGTWELQQNDISDLGTPGRALDIGANVGFYSLVLAASGWNVTAFEPMKANTELIEASMCANPELAERITLNKFGLGSKDDHCIIFSDDFNVGDGHSACGDDAKKPMPAHYHKRASMDIQRLDDALAKQNIDHVDFVKMDVEGFECQVMAGGQSLLNKFRPRMIQSEVWPDMQGCLPQDFLASFAKAKYDVAKDRECTTPDLSRPTAIDNRFMCKQTKPNAGLSLAEIAESVASYGQRQRSIVWLTPSEQAVGSGSR